MSATGTTETLVTTLADILPPLAPNAQRLYLLRHGQTDWNAEGRAQGGGFDIELNQVGRRQAEIVADELDGIPLDVIASSHLKRSRQTADIVHSLHHSDAKRVVMRGFGEMRFGEFEGYAIRGPLCTPERKAYYLGVAATLRESADTKWPGGGESTRDVETRGRLALQQLLNDTQAQHIAIVAHGRFNKIMLSSLLYQDSTKHQDITQGNTCVNVLDFEGDECTSQLLNYVDHVES